MENTAAVNCIVFSKDRAIQLDGLLRSLFRHCKDIGQANISVLYTTTNERHASQYRALGGEYAGRVVFVKQQEFRRNILSILIANTKVESRSIYSALSAIGNAGFPLGSFVDRIWRRTFGQIPRILISRFAPALPDQSNILFLVDDNIFVRDFLLGDIVDALNSQSDLIGFSLRLGENTTYCYPLNQTQALPEFIHVKKDIVKFDWTKSEHDFGYPLEVSSSMYRLKDILPLAMGLAFENPNTLEDRMAFNARAFRSSYSFLGCYLRSVTFCNPVNMVQIAIPNRAGEEIRHAVDDLADRFDRCERIRIEEFRLMKVL